MTLRVGSGWYKWQQQARRIRSCPVHDSLPLHHFWPRLWQGTILAGFHLQTLPLFPRPYRIKSFFSRNALIQLFYAFAQFCPFAAEPFGPAEHYSGPVKHRSEFAERYPGPSNAILTITIKKIP
jgi:hypothetical protein